MKKLIAVSTVLLLCVLCFPQLSAEDKSEVRNPQPYLQGLELALGDANSSGSEANHDKKNVVIVIRGKVSSMTENTLSVPSNIGDLEISVAQINNEANGLDVEVGDDVTVYGRLESLCPTSKVISAHSIHLD